MKKWIIAGLVVMFSIGVRAETVTNNLNVQGGFVYNHGAVNPGDIGLTFTNAGIRDITVSAGQLSGVDPGTGAVITNSANLLPLKAQSLTTASNIVATGSFIGNGSGLTSLDAGAISTGSIDADRLPTSGSWNAAGVTVSNLTVSGAGISGDVAAMTNLTLGSAPLAQAVSNLQQQVAAVYSSKSSVMVQVTDNETTNGVNLIAAYAKAKTLNPSSSNRVAVIVPPGRYDLTGSGLVMDTSYIDVIGLTTDRGVQYLYGGPSIDGGVIKQTADYVRIENLTLFNPAASSAVEGPSVYFPTVAGSNTVIRNCEFVSPMYGSTRTGVAYAGYYENCFAGMCSFGYWSNGIASGTFINCQAGVYSFGAYNGVASGTFTDCKAGDYSFGSYGSSTTYSNTPTKASGTFTRCKAGNYSFGCKGDASGTFTDCQAGGGSFGYASKASGRFTRCTSTGAPTAISFGSGTGGEASGVFVECRSIGIRSFGGSGGVLSTSAILVNCTASSFSFGTFNMAAMNFNYNASGYRFAGGPIVGDGSGLTNLNVSSLSGTIPATSLPTSGVWIATGVTVSNLTVNSVAGNVESMTNLTLNNVSLAQAISNIQQQVAAKASTQSVVNIEGDISTLADVENSYVVIDGFKYPVDGFSYSRPHYTTDIDNGGNYVSFQTAGWVYQDEGRGNLYLTNSSLSFIPPLTGWYDANSSTPTNLNIQFFSGKDAQQQAQIDLLNSQTGTWSTITAKADSADLTAVESRVDSLESSSAEHGSRIASVESQVSGSVLVDGTRAMQASLDMGGHTIANLGTADSDDSAASQGRVKTMMQQVPEYGDLSMGAFTTQVGLPERTIPAVIHTADIADGAVTLSKITGVLDEDDMASNSSTNLATQQSIKAYVDSRRPRYVSITNHTVIGSVTNANTTTTASSKTYTISGFTGGAGLDTERITALHINVKGRLVKNTDGDYILMTATYPDGSTQPVYKCTMYSGYDGTCEQIVTVPIDAGQTDITLTLTLNGGNTGRRLEYRIIGATQQ